MMIKWLLAVQRESIENDNSELQLDILNHATMKKSGDEMKV